MLQLVGSDNFLNKILYLPPHNSECHCLDFFTFLSPLNTWLLVFSGILFVPQLIILYKISLNDFILADEFILQALYSCPFLHVFISLSQFQMYTAKFLHQFCPFLSCRYLKHNISQNRLQIYSSKSTLSFLAKGILNFQLLIHIHIISISISDSFIDLPTHPILNILLFIFKHNALSPTFSWEISDCS